MVEVRVTPVVLIGLLEHDPVSGCGVEDLLEHNISDIGYQCNHRQYYCSHVCFGRDTRIPDLTSNLRLEEEGDVGSVKNHHRHIVQSHTEDSSRERYPIPVYSLDVNFDTNDVDDHSEGYATGEPMGLSLAILIGGSFQSVDSAKVGRCSMPDGKDNPSPEDLQIEEFTLLTCFVDDRVSIDEFIVDVLVDHIRE